MSETEELRVEDIARHFLRAEIRRERYDLLRNALGAGSRWMWEMLQGVVGQNELTAVSRERLHLLRRALGNPNTLTNSEVMVVVRWLGNYGSTRIPLIPFTVGCLEDDRSDEVTGWSLEDVPLGELWIEKVDEDSTRILAAHQHNLVDALDALPTEEWPDWITGHGEAEHPIICLDRQKDGRKGRYWILDGCHRAAGVARVAGDRRTKTIKAYVGQWSGDEA